MTFAVDHTNDPAARSWIESANEPGNHFPIQNLPFGVFSCDDDDGPRIGVAIGDQILNLRAMIERGMLPDLASEAACALCASSLNDFMGLGRAHWSAVRRMLFDLLVIDSSTLRDDADARAAVLCGCGCATMHLPAEIGDYTDFYASIHHATNVGSMFRPDNPLLPNYQHIPIGYHGRASSIVVSGAEVHRPHGQLVGPDGPPPSFGPCRLMDYEMEMGVFVGSGNAPGTRIAMEDAADHLFGMVVVNDWSARDIQKWEYQPLGPFNAKNFATTISPWVVTFDALAPYLIDGPYRGEGDPAPLPYLQPTEPMGIDMTVQVSVRSASMRESAAPAHIISTGNFRDMYWTVAQMLVHHASGGCNLQPGDLFASGTISNAEESSRGCLLERTWRGQNPVAMPDGSERKFLLDGDEVQMTAWCGDAEKLCIGFGQCTGIVQSAV